MERKLMRIIACLFIVMIILFPLSSYCENKNEKTFIIRVTEVNNPEGQISFSGDIMAMTEKGFAPISISQSTPFVRTLKTSFVSTKFHATSFLPHKIKVEIIERTKNQDYLLIAGAGYRVFLQAGANGSIFVSSH